MASNIPLTATWFNRPTRKVAQDLLGCLLVRRVGRKLYCGLITETEAYCGPRDRANHASRGRTARTEVMFGEPGRTYIYLIYGMYHCLNIVTERADYPAAVLIRGLQAYEPISARRPIVVDQLPALAADTADGPGKLCRWLKIDRALNNQALTVNNGLWVLPRVIKPRQIKKLPRVGVDYAGAYKDKPWRYVAGW